MLIITAMYYELPSLFGYVLIAFGFLIIALITYSILKNYTFENRDLTEKQKKLMSLILTICGAIDFVSCLLI